MVAVGWGVGEVVYGGSVVEERAGVFGWVIWVIFWVRWGWLLAGWTVQRLGKVGYSTIYEEPYKRGYTRQPPQKAEYYHQDTRFRLKMVLS